MGNHQQDKTPFTYTKAGIVYVNGVLPQWATDYCNFQSNFSMTLRGSP